MLLYKSLHFLTSFSLLLSTPSWVLFSPLMRQLTLRTVTSLLLNTEDIFQDVSHMPSAAPVIPARSSALTSMPSYGFLLTSCLSFVGSSSGPFFPECSCSSWFSWGLLSHGVHLPVRFPWPQPQDGNDSPTHI